jgi:ribonuclease VapC
MSKFVFDRFAMLAFFQDEPGAMRVQQIMEAGSHERWISTINVGETFYISARRSDLLNAEEVLQDLLKMPMQIVEPWFALTMKAAQLKARHRLSYADCFAAALAMRFDAAVVTGDPEFEQIEDIVDIEWLPAKPKNARR